MATVDREKGGEGIFDNHGVQVAFRPESFVKENWVLTALGDSQGRRGVYDGGGIWSMIGVSDGLTGFGQKLVKEIGATGFGRNVSGHGKHEISRKATEAAGAKQGVLYERITSSPEYVLIAFTLLAGQREGLRRYQEEHGTQFLDVLLGDEREAEFTPQERVMQVATAYDLLSDEMRENINRNGRFDAFWQRARTNLTQPIAVYLESELASGMERVVEPVQELPQGLPAWRGNTVVERVLARGVSFFADTAYERISRYVDGPTQSSSLRPAPAL